MFKHIRTGLVAALALAVACPVAAAGPHDGYILFGAGEQWSTMSGSTDDLRHARGIRQGKEPLLVVRRDGGVYVVRDAETLRRAQAILAPQAELGRKQGALGAQQGVLGAKQGALGAQQAHLGMRQINASSQSAEAFGRQQEELGRQQEALGRQQDALGRQQDALGREQEIASRKAEVELSALIDDAVKRGVAKRAD